MGNRFVILGVSVGLAVVIWSVISAAGAAADNLCSEAPNAANECPVGKAYAVGQEFKFTTANVEFNSTVFGLVKCGESELKFSTIELVAGARVKGLLEELSFGKCKNPLGEACRAGAMLPANVGIGQVGAGEGSLVLEALKAGEPYELELECKGLPCALSVNKWSGGLKGAKPATLAFNLALVVKPALCGKATFKVTYTAVNPEPIWTTK